MQWLHQQRHEKMSVAVSYQRIAGGSALSLQGTRGRTDNDQGQVGELVTAAVVDDWLFRADDFITGGTFVPPAKRDTVTETATGKVWEVVELPSEPVWRYSEQYRNAIRVHVKELVN
jgi:hypothetical protein